MRSSLLVACLGAALTVPTAAQTDGPYERMIAGQESILAYLRGEARRLTDAAAAELTSARDWEAARERRLGEMREMLGLAPPPPKTPLNVRITGRLDQGDYVIEKIAYESLPRVYVTANFYIPKSPAGPRPTVVYVCGHSYSPFGAKVQYQRHAITLAKHGYAAFIIDPIQIAETFALHHGVFNNEMYDWYARGYSPAGLEVWNIIRALDYLETREEVDRERFGVTGRSGGAAMSWFSAAVDERLKAAVPVMGISTYAANVEDNTQKRHCDCMFPVNNRLHGMLHQGALIAPRPLLMAHGRLDPLFPVPGYEEFERRLRRLYDGYGRESSFKNIVVESDHKDSDFLRAEAVKWFDKHLMGVPEREIDVSHDDLPGERLAVFGGEPPADALNYRVHEFFIPGPPERTYSTLAEWKIRREELLDRLRSRVFAALPEASGEIATYPGAAPSWRGFDSLRIETEPGVLVEAHARHLDGAGAPLLYVASDGDDEPGVLDILRQVSASESNPLLVLYPRGVGEVPWPKKFWKDVLRNAMHLGRTVDSMRVWDVMTAARLLRARTGREPVIAGSGVAGALGLYAGILDEGVAQTILLDAPSSHREGPVFLNVLRYTDLPEAAALMAPRRVTFYGRMPAAYRLTQGVFALHGAPDRLFLTMSLEAALNGRFHHGFASGL